MTPTAIIIFVLYLIVLQAVGLYAGRGRKNFHDYFQGDGKIPWWVICFSIVATETSSLTFISVPAVSYGGNLGFLQIAFGYIIGRILVAYFFLPSYFAGSLETVYHFLEQRYSSSMRKIAAVTFSVTRLLGDAVRLFATAIPLSILTGWPLAWCILAFVAATLPYTLAGGIRSVVFTDALQMMVYVGGGIAVLYFLFPELSTVPAAKWQVVSLGFENGFSSFFTKPYHLAGGVIGGLVLTLFTHGTDQLLVQRLLAAGNLNSARKALITSGFLVAMQFGLFLVIGLGLYVFFQGKEFATPDSIFPEYIITHLPDALKAVIIAAIFASAQSTLSSTLNSLASSSLLDLFPAVKMKPEKTKVLWSRLLTVFWAVLLSLVALAISDQKSPVVILGLKIASVPAGAVIALYIFGLRRKDQFDAQKSIRLVIFVFVFSMALMSGVVFLTPLAWVWYAPLGLGITLSGLYVTQVK